MNQQRHELVCEFINRTNASADQAQSCLETCHWNLQDAVTRFQTTNMAMNQSDNGENKNEAIVQDILHQAAEGAQSNEPFIGQGYTLDKPVKSEPETVTRTLIFWRDGFSVDDGPLYPYSDPINQDMLTAIRSGRAPLALLGVQHGQPVKVKVIKRQKEDYKQIKKPLFEGKGNRLGSPITYNSPLLSSPLTVDETKPTTTIQVRLANGTRLVCKLNETHTIGDIRQWINKKSHSSDTSYVLQTMFPVKALSDNQQTIKEAGLLNSVIIQQYN